MSLAYEDNLNYNLPPEIRMHSPPPFIYSIFLERKTSTRALLKLLDYYETCRLT